MKPEYPEILGYGYILSFLSEIGYARSGGMGGLIPLDFDVIYSYMMATKTDLNSFEVQTLRQLSQAYVNQSRLDAEYEKPPFSNYSDEEYLKRSAISSCNILAKFR